MIYIGTFDIAEIVADYVAKHGIRHVWTMGEATGVEGETVTPWNGLDLYANYTPLRSSIQQGDLVVMNGIMRTSKRTDLKLNCLRQYVVQTKHRLAFEPLPFHEREEDLAIVSDMMQDNPFLKEDFDRDEFRKLLAGVSLPPVTMRIVRRELDPALVNAYLKEKERIFAKLKGSPSVLPKQCLKVSQTLCKEGDDKATFKPDGYYVETQLGVDRYFCDILRYKADIMRSYCDGI